MTLLLTSITDGMRLLTCLIVRLLEVPCRCKRFSGVQGKLDRQVTKPIVLLEETAQGQQDKTCFE